MKMAAGQWLGSGQPQIHSTLTKPPPASIIHVKCKFMQILHKLCEVHIGKLRHRELQQSTWGNTFTVGRARLQSGSKPLLPAWAWISHALTPQQGHLTYPELRHLDDEAHGHVDDGTLPVVHRDKVGGQLIEPCVEPLRETEGKHQRLPVLSPSDPVPSGLGLK